MEIHPLLGRLRQNAQVSWALTDQAIVSLANFVTGVLVARHMGISDFGRFTLIWLMVQFVQSIQHAAINSPMMSIGPKLASDEEPRYYGSVFFHQILFGLASTVLTYLAARASGIAFPDWHIESLALPLAIATLTCQLQDFLRRYYFTIARPAMSLTSDVVRYAAQILALLVLYSGALGAISLEAVVWVLAGCAFLGFAATCYGVRALEWSHIHFRELSIRHWHFSKWLAISTLFVWASGNLVSIFAGALLGVRATGILRAAQNIIGITHIFFQGLENVLPARAAMAFHLGGLPALRAFTARATLFTTAATVLLAGAAAAFAGPLMVFLYGESARGAGWVLVGFAVIYVVNSVSLAMRSALRALERTRTILVSYALAAVFSVGVAPYLVGHFGILGALGSLGACAVILLAVTYAGLQIEIRSLLSSQSLER